MKKAMKKVLALVLTVLMCVSVVLPVMAESATSGCPGVGERHTLDTCTNHTKVGDPIAPTCEKQGYQAYQCNDCKVLFAGDIKPALSNNGNCTWTVTTKASCFADGLKTCSKCGATEVIPKRAHDLDPVAGSATCGEPGAMITLECVNVADSDGLYETCNYTEQAEAGDNHTWEITEVDAPSCGDPGLATYTCSKCDFSKDVVIYSTDDHHYENVDAKPMICEEGKEEEGWIAHKKCKDCGVVSLDGVNVVDYDEEIAIPVAHDFDENNPTSVVLPTCTAPGFKFFGCKACGGVADTIVIKPLPHITDKADYGKDGSEGKEINLVGTVTTPIDCTINQNQVTTYTCKGNGQATCGFQWTQTTLVVGSEAAKKAGHEIEVIVVEPNCTEGGYTYKFCAACNAAKHTTACAADCDVLHGKIGENYDLTDAVPDAHVWANSQMINAPTCTTTGMSVSYCTKCHIVEDDHVEAALGHGWERTYPAGTAEKDKLYSKVYDCKNGVWVYTCTDPNCDDLDNNRTTEPIDEDFDIDDITWHRDYKNGAWTGANPVVVRNRTCTVSGLTIYTCSCGYGVLVEEAAGHTLTKARDYKTPTCLIDGNYGEWGCSVCNGTVYTLADDTEYKFVAAGATPFNNVIPKLSTDNNHLSSKKVVYKAAADPTCEDKGNTEGWYCSVCCTYEVDEDDVTITPIYTGITNAYAYATELPAINHDDSDIADYKHVTIVTGVDNKKVVTASLPTCTEYAYAHYVCPDCDLEWWDNYADAIEHDTDSIVVKPTCDDIGTETIYCKNGDRCPITADAAGYKVVEVIETPRLGHKDAEGEAIDCVFEDFYCSVCSPRVDGDGDPVLDADGEQYMDIVDWERSHNWTSKVYDATCQEYEYTLTWCEDCLYQYVSNTGFEYADHNFTKTGTPANTLNATAGNVKVTKVDTYATKGEYTISCQFGCGTKTTEEFDVLKGLAFSINADNGVVAGNRIVNSGLIAVTVKTTSYKTAVWGVQFTVAFDNQYVEFVPSMTKVHNDAFATTTKAAAQNIEPDFAVAPSAQYVDRDDVVTVAAYTSKTTDGKLQNTEFNGENVNLVTLYFRVLGDANLAVPYTTFDFVEVNNAPAIITDAAGNAVDANYVEMKAADLTKLENDFNAGKIDIANAGDEAVVRIFALGDVNGDAAYTATGYATIVDARAILEMVEANKGAYNAMADVDKNGKVEAADMANLMKYISGELQYHELCALGVKA